MFSSHQYICIEFFRRQGAQGVVVSQLSLSTHSAQSERSEPVKFFVLFCYLFLAPSGVQSVTMFMCLSVRLAQSCLKHFIFTFLTPVCLRSISMWSGGFSLWLRDMSLTTYRDLLPLTETCLLTIISLYKLSYLLRSIDRAYITLSCFRNF